jgi:hypothetical protein
LRPQGSSIESDIKCACCATLNQACSLAKLNPVLKGRLRSWLRIELSDGKETPTPSVDDPTHTTPTIDSFFSPATFPATLTDTQLQVPSAAPVDASANDYSSTHDYPQPSEASKSADIGPSTGQAPAPSIFEIDLIPEPVESEPCILPPLEHSSTPSQTTDTTTRDTDASTLVVLSKIDQYRATDPQGCIDQLLKGV